VLMALAHLSLLPPRIDDFRGAQRQKGESDQRGEFWNRL
jgi:hypothetical protein